MFECIFVFLKVLDLYLMWKGEGFFVIGMSYEIMDCIEDLCMFYFCVS